MPFAMRSRHPGFIRAGLSGSTGPSRHYGPRPGPIRSRHPSISHAGSIASKLADLAGQFGGLGGGGEVGGAMTPGQRAVALGAAGPHMHYNRKGELKRGRRPRMRVTNVRALHRAIRRAEGFRKIAMQVIRLTHPHQLRGKRWGGFKRKTKRR